MIEKNQVEISKTASNKIMNQKQCLIPATTADNNVTTNILRNELVVMLTTYYLTCLCGRYKSQMCHGE